MKKILLIILFLFQLNLVSHEVYADEKPAILVISSACEDHMAGFKLFSIDPQLERNLKKQGYQVAKAYYSVLTYEMLAKFNMIIMLQEPPHVADSPKPFEVFKSKLDMIKRYIEEGGGAVVFFDERHYAFEWDYSINYFLRMFDAEVAAETYHDIKENYHNFDMISGNESGAYRTKNIARHDVTNGVNELWYPSTSRVINVSQDWQVIVKGEKTARTQNTYKSEPPIVAVRQAGKGRIALFAGLSSFYTLNGYHRTYENGWMFNQGDGEKFFENLYGWLSTPSFAVASLGNYGGEKLFDESVRPGTEIKKIKASSKTKPRAGLIGLYSAYSGGALTVAEYAEKAKDLGLDYIAFTDKIIDSKTWRELVSDCRDVSDENFVAIPGVEFKTSWNGNEQGLTGFMINGDKWPPLYGKSFISVKLRTGEEHGSLVSVAQPKENALAPWNIGGFNSLEIASYKGSEQYSAALDTYRWYASIPSVGWYPVVSHRIWNLDQMENAVESGYKNYFYAEKISEIRDVPGEGLTPGFVSNGPVINRFATDEIMKDPWEHYYLWEPGQKCLINIDVLSKDKIKTVKLFSGNRLLRCFRPKSKGFKSAVLHPISQEGSFYLEVVDCKGRTAYSYTIPTRNMYFWNHVGSDAMNDYHTSVAEDPLGDLVYNGKRYGYGGLVTFGYGWGNYCRFYHPVPVEEFHPHGYETGQIPAGLKNTRTYPQVWYTNRSSRNSKELANALPKRSVPVSSGDLAYIRENVDYVNQNGRAFETEFFNSQADVLLYRYDYRPFGYILMKVDNKLEVKTLEGQNVNLEARKGLEISLLELSYQSSKMFNQLTWIDENGQKHSERIDISDPQTLKLCKVAAGSYVTLSPEPFGQTGLFVTEGDYDVEIVGGENPKILIGHDMNNGKLSNGQTFEGHFIVLEEGGGQGVEVCDELRDVWGLDGSSAYKPDMLYGELLSSLYVLDMEAKDNAVVVDFSDDIPRLPNNILPVRVNGVNGNWSCGWVRAGDYHQSASAEGVLYASLKMPVKGQYFIGNPIVSDNPDVVIEVLESGNGKYAISLHNPKKEVVKVTVESNKVLTSLKIHEDVVLKPGQTKVLNSALSFDD